MTREEYDKAVKTYSGRLFRYVLKCLRNEEDAHDIVQDSFAKLWVHREKVDPKKAKSWLFTTSHNALINLAKKKKRESSLDSAEYLEPSVRSDQKRMEAKEIIDICVEQLPEVQKSILLLRDLEGYNYKEIGEILELNESQVKVYLFRARKKIKDLIKDLTLLS